MNPVELTYFDADADGRRGATRLIAIYRHRANAQAAADEGNARLIAQWNSKWMVRHEENARKVSEWNALYEAGLRPERRFMPEPFVPAESVNDPRYHLDRYSVEEIEYEDE